MAIILHFQTLRPDQIAFSFSPGQEAVVSLHVLADCSHHPLHVPWVIQTRKQLGPALKAELDAFQVLYQRCIIGFWEPEPGVVYSSFEEAITVQEKTPIDSYVDQVSMFLLGSGVTLDTLMQDDLIRQEMIDSAGTQYPQSVAMIKELLDDPVRSRQHFLDVLSAYWECCLMAEWPRLEDAFLQDIERRRQSLLDEGVLCLLSTLSPELYVSFQTGHGTRISDHDFSVTFDDTDTLTLMPSYFVWPHVLTAMQRPYYLQYPIQDHWSQGQAPIPPERLLKLIRATGDLTRMQILQLLSQQERSTRELAGIIGISESAISKHLRMLQDSGLIKSHRNSYYVFYYLDPGSIADLTHGVTHLLAPAKNLSAGALNRVRFPDLIGNHGSY